MGMSSHEHFSGYTREVHPRYFVCNFLARPANRLAVVARVLSSGPSSMFQDIAWHYKRWWKDLKPGDKRRNLVRIAFSLLPRREARRVTHAFKEFTASPVRGPGASSRIQFPSCPTNTCRRNPDAPAPHRSVRSQIQAGVATAVLGLAYQQHLVWEE